MKNLTDKQLLLARQEFKTYFSQSKAQLSKINIKTDLQLYKKAQLNNSFEALGCIGYNSTFRALTATIQIKKTYGYLGQLCSKGSYEYVRFYIDYKKGEGWEDLGYVGLNVHDIPDTKGCDGLLKKPIDYVVRLPFTPKIEYCSVENLPKIKAVLLWNAVPEAEDSTLSKGTYTWGDVQEADIQIEPFIFKLPDFKIPEVAKVLDDLVLNPNLSLNTLLEQAPNPPILKSKFAALTKKENFNFSQLASHYKPLEIEPHRFGFKMLAELEHTTTLSTYATFNTIFKANKLSLDESLVALSQLKCNTSYEELVCVGADYHNDALVATLKLKRPNGYSGNLCSSGSKEYVSFWLQTEDCEWIHAGTKAIRVHDIKDFPKGGLFYSVVQPYNFDALRTNCKTPKVLRVKAVLSWGTPPVGMACSRWGNTLDRLIEIAPLQWNGKLPQITAIGGVAVSEIKPNGLTVFEAKIGDANLNALEDSGFQGRIVVKGIVTPFIGQKYRVKVTNETKGTSYYVTDEFYVKGTGVNRLQKPVGDVYTYLANEKVLAIFSPRTDDLLTLTIENVTTGLQSSGHSFQMDSTPPKLALAIDDGGNCTHYTKGGIITGTYSVQEQHLSKFRLATSITEPVSVLKSSDASDPTSGNFSVVSSKNLNCGKITLRAYPRTVVNSIRMHSGVRTERIVCLADA
jgi:hypothetical protein